ncbi:MAG: Ni/Fe hydrogenase subunit alpha [Anaerolineales bacterium]|nr:Ni/Fe hydrogenase subunit alpha [Anaerolineales bacterium]
MMEKITIEPITRIEGHAKVTIHLDDDGNVAQSYFHVNEFRGFEKFCEGRMYYEMPSITPRICGICPVSHHLASVKACDQVVGAPPPRPANLLRELMHMGQMIQSHGMHFFELAGPDLLLGFDSDPATRNVVGLIQANPELALKAVALRKYGQEIIRLVGGRRIHPNFAVPGGVNKQLSVTERDEMLAGYEENLATVQVGLDIIKNWAAENMNVIEEFAVFQSGYGGLVTEDGNLELYDGEFKLIDKDGEKLEQFPGEDYLDYIAEHVEDWSYLKFPYYKKMGYPGGVYRVGPLGRLNVTKEIDTPLANEELTAYKAINPGKPLENTLYFHYARLIETVFSMERAKELLEDPDILSADILNTHQEYTGTGVGVIEAPRGTLFHHYWANPDGKLERVNLIVATGHNNWSMNHSVGMVAKHYIKNGDVREGLLNRVEAAIRAHDPCLSCSTHALGQMPIEIKVYNQDEELLEEVRRD